MSYSLKAFRGIMLVALWFSLLFLPFKGPLGAIILFASIVVSISLFRALRRVRFRGIKLSLPYSRYYTLFLLIFLFLFPLFVKDYYLDVAILSCIYVILTLGLNVVVGFTGLLNLGFVAFYAIGAYTYALLNLKLGLGFWQSLPFCLMASTIAGFVLAIPALRLKGDYLAIVTLGFGEITRLILNNWDSLTGGPNGLTGISSPVIFGLSLGRLNRYYYLVLFVVIICYIIIKRVRESKIGRAWLAIREDEISAGSMGVNVTLYKLYAFSFGAFWAGLAGALFAAKMQFISPESFTFIESVLILCMVILGGLGSIEGVIIGALILVILPEVLRGVQNYRMLALGIGLILMMIFRPHGIFGSTMIKKASEKIRVSGGANRI